MVEAISETIKQYVLTRENLGNMTLSYFHFYMREFITREYEDDSDVSWKKIAELLFYVSEEFYNTEDSANIDRTLQEVLQKVTMPPWK